MKINQWTLGLAAVGVVSFASVAKADESTMSAVKTALSSTTISGYVDTSINWNSIDNAFQAPIPYSSNKQDGFNLNVVKLSIEKALDESEWAAGYKVDLLFGPDAIAYNDSANNFFSGSGFGASEVGIKQAYAALRTPVGNGIDWKIGVFDTIIGYETFEAGNNPNFTRSYGNAIEPTQHTGILATYRVNDMIAVAAGLANTLSAGINVKNDELGAARTTDAWRKTAMASVAVTAPEDMGFLSGSTLYAGIVSGINQAAGGNDTQNNYYVGGTMNTPVTGLKAGFAFDYVTGLSSVQGNDAYTLAGYLSYQATEKLSLHGRAEIGKADNDNGAVTTIPANSEAKIFALTGTVQYDLWANVISRLEVRYDQSDISGAAPASTDPDSAVGLYANIIYKF